MTQDPSRWHREPRLGGQLFGLRDVMIGTQAEAVVADVSFDIHQGDRIALVGRNGSGKSTLLKLLTGLIEPDQGEVRRPAGLRVGYLPQDPDLSSYATLGAYCRDGLTLNEYHLADRVAALFNFDPDQTPEQASGGEIRQAGLVRLFSRPCDLYLFDEPTNHLDLVTIEWLEQILPDLGAAFVIVSHDRRMLSATTHRTIWVDRGRVRVMECGYREFPDRQETVLLEEERRRRHLDRQIRTETLWATEGISARRKRNQGRLRRLDTLRRERAEMRRIMASPDMTATHDVMAGQMVIEARTVSFSFGQHALIDSLSLRILKGDRLAIIGPNGIGKTTLVEILTGRRKPDRGWVRIGKTLTLASLDQNRRPPNPNMTVRRFLTGEGAHARDRPDHVIHQGRSRHVISYLKAYQFDRTVVDAPLMSLSGGELGRLHLARIMLRETDLLVLDEPTNDLDMDMLDMLQQALARYPGTVILVSHDRDFLDNVATLTLALGGCGAWTVYPGGWSTAHDQGYRARGVGVDEPQGSAGPKRGKVRPAIRVRESGLTFAERHRLEDLDGLIAGQAALVSRKQAAIDAAPHSDDYESTATLLRELAALQEQLRTLEDEWLDLAERAG
ncbi:MAG: ATP-binding cassette domain-containing protein [Rhodobacteraceae bacterium]|nr:ATP-binding cassette domain-containing protein [Paracoccaceae bacterium]